MNTYMPYYKNSFFIVVLLLFALQLPLHAMSNDESAYQCNEGENKKKSQRVIHYLPSSLQSHFRGLHQDSGFLPIFPKETINSNKQRQQLKTYDSFRTYCPLVHWLYTQKKVTTLECYNEIEVLFYKEIKTIKPSEYIALLSSNGYSILFKQSQERDGDEEETSHFKVDLTIIQVYAALAYSNQLQNISSTDTLLKETMTNILSPNSNRSARIKFLESIKKYFKPEKEHGSPATE